MSDRENVYTLQKTGKRHTNTTTARMYTKADKKHLNKEEKKICEEISSKGNARTFSI